METFDDILKVTGKFGWYQWRIFFFVCVGQIAFTLLTFTQVFTGGKGDFWCEGSKFVTDDCLEWNKTSSECENLKEMSTCMNYNFTFQEEEEELKEYAETMKCDNGWVFDHSVYASTFTEEWELVCDRGAVNNILQSVYLSGFLVGTIVFGATADRYGRYFTFVFTLVGVALLTLLSALSPNPVVFGILRFFIAACNYGLSLVSFVIVTEMVMPRQRVFVATAVWYFIAIGYLGLSALGKFISSWRLFILLTASPFLLLVPSFLYVDESARWLLTKERYEDADKVINKIAATNNKSLPQDYLAQLQESKGTGETPKGNVTILDLFRNPVLRLYLLNLLYNWFVQSFVFYGLSLGTSTLGVDVFIAFFISGAVEIPAYTFSAFSMRYLGRKVSTSGLMILAGLACFATIPAPPGPLRVVFAMIGKFAISASFGNIYVLTAEIFPTPIRAASVGTCSIAARVGGLVAPLVLLLENVWVSLHLILFASSSVLGGLLVCFLPETRGKRMPDTIEDSLNLKTRERSDDAV